MAYKSIKTFGYFNVCILLYKPRKMSYCYFCTGNVAYIIWPLIFSYNNKEGS